MVLNTIEKNKGDRKGRRFVKILRKGWSGKAPLVIYEVNRLNIREQNILWYSSTFKCNSTAYSILVLVNMKRCP